MAAAVDPWPSCRQARPRRGAAEHREPAQRRVDGRTKLTAAQRPCLEINPLGLAPDDALDRARLQQWLSFIGTELHKALFGLLLDRRAAEAMRAYARELSTARLGRLERHLTGRETPAQR